MAKTIKIEIAPGTEMYADLFEEKSPLTCDEFIKTLPYTCKTLEHDKYSGSTMKFYADFKQPVAECSRSYGVFPGNILYVPHIIDSAKQENEIMIVYGPAAIRNISGFGIANLFGQIRPEYLEELYKTGNDLILHGDRKITVTLAEC